MPAQKLYPNPPDILKVMSKDIQYIQLKKQITLWIYVMREKLNMQAGWIKLQEIAGGELFQFLATDRLNYGKLVTSWNLDNADNELKNAAIAHTLSPFMHKQQIISSNTQNLATQAHMCFGIKCSDQTLTTAPKVIVSSEGTSLFSYSRQHHIRKAWCKTWPFWRLPNNPHPPTCTWPFRPLPNTTMCVES